MTKICELDRWLASLYGRVAVDSTAVLERDWVEANSRGRSEGRSMTTIKIIEVVNDRTIIVAWQDPTGGRYGYQTWTRVLARHDAVCALTRFSVKMGDAVFHPKNLRDRRPANADSVILAGEVQRNLSAAAHANHPRNGTAQRDSTPSSRRNTLPRLATASDATGPVPVEVENSDGGFQINTAR